MKINMLIIVLHHLELNFFKWFLLYNNHKTLFFYFSNQHLHHSKALIVTVILQRDYFQLIFFFCTQDYKHVDYSLSNGKYKLIILR